MNSIRKHSNVTVDNVKIEKELDTVKVLNTLASQVWPAGKPAIKARVVTALGLLIGSKVTIYYLFKYNVFLFVCNSYYYQRNYQPFFAVVIKVKSG